MRHYLLKWVLVWIGVVGFLANPSQTKRTVTLGNDDNILLKKLPDQTGDQYKNSFPFLIMISVP